MVEVARIVMGTIVGCRAPSSDGVLKMSIRSAVVSHFEEVASAQHRKLARLTDDLKLVDSGLDSLSLALIVARLEDTLGVDPFDSVSTAEFPVTFGDFVSLYERRAR